jgi:hypothetical protein
MSATKMFPLAFGVSNCASVAFVTVKLRLVMLGVDPPLQSPEDVHSTSAVNIPVPSAMNGDSLANPERPPLGEFGEDEMVVIVEPDTESLKSKRAFPPAPVSTNLFPLASDTTTLTLVPFCVRVTVPNPDGTLPPSHAEPDRWQDVKVKESADAFGVPTVSRRKAITIAAANVMRFI